MLLLAESTVLLSCVSGNPFGARFFQTSFPKAHTAKDSEDYLRLVFTTGHYVVKLLQVLRIFKEFMNCGVSTIVKGWRFHGYRKNWRKNKDFMKG